jgi:hypothetical protein
MGIAECSFTKEEILDEFKLLGIDIPKCFMEEFDNRIQKMKRIRYEREWERTQLK